MSDFRLVQFATVGIYFIAILGLNFLTGYSGQISLGHGAFMAIGGYTSAILIVHHGWSDLATIPVAGLVAGVAGLLFGIPALRLSGLYLALATFALAVSMPSIIKKWESETGGSSGLLVNVFHTNRWYYTVTWITRRDPLRARLAAAPDEVQPRVARDPRQRGRRRVDGDQPRALQDARRSAISALYAGVAGALLVILSFGANPGSFPIQLSIYLVVGLAVAGLGGSLCGLLVGAAFVEYVQVWAPELSKSPGVPDRRVRRGARPRDVPAARRRWPDCPGTALKSDAVGRKSAVVRDTVESFPVCALSLLAVAARQARARTDPGVSATSVKIGGTVPLTGVAAAYARSAAAQTAYFKYVNDTKGGVNGRKIDYEYLDDAYDPSKTVEQTRKLVQQDGVFAVFNSLGTEQTSRARAFLNQAQGAAALRRDRRDHVRPRLQAVPVVDRLPAELRRRGDHLRPVHPRERRRRRRSPSSTRTTTSARSCQRA